MAAFPGASLRDMPAFTFSVPAATHSYRPTLTAAWYADVDVRVPTDSSQRSIYLHGLNIVLEGLCGTTDDPPTKRNETNGMHRWRCILDRLLTYWFENRSVMTPEHRRMLWLVAARIKFILNRTTPSHREIHQCEVAVTRSLQMTTTRIPQQSVRFVWMTLYALMLAWKTLRMTADVEAYVDALFTQVGRLVWMALPDPAVFDHPGFVTTVDDFEYAGVLAAGKVDFGGDIPRRTFCVNAGFIGETERIFSTLLADISMWNIMKTQTRVQQAPRARRYVETMEWIRSCISVEARREGVQELFEKRIYDRRAHPGEIEILAERDAHQLHNAYNAIARFRPNVIDRASELIEGDATIEDLITVAEKWKPADQQLEPTATSAAAAAAAAAAVDTDIPDESMSQRRRRISAEADQRGDAGDVILCSVATSLDGCMASDTLTFMDFFTTTSFPVSSTKRNVPVFFYAGGDWHILHGDDFFMCETIVDAVDCWIARLCADSTILEALAHIAPNVDGFFEAHRIIVGEASAYELARVQRHLATMNVSAIALPSCYSS